MLRKMMRSAAALIVLGVMITAATACAASSSAGSRSTLYDSLDAISADSSALVIGTVRQQVGEGSTTVSSVEVTNAPSNPQLGSNLDDDPAAVEVGDVVEVRQDAEPFLESGVEYLLFLTPSELPGDAASQYFITGAVAGLYERDGGEFRRVVTDSGDKMPETITIAE